MKTPSRESVKDLLRAFLHSRGGPGKEGNAALREMLTRHGADTFADIKDSGLWALAVDLQAAMDKK